jgi:ABC-type multidrug transport system fused ATPase/permease subunit
MKGKTSVAIAHRISTIKDANQILVFENGEIVEKGNYDELVEAQGKFYKLEKGT